MKQSRYKEIFNGKCPYTDIACDDWECNTCEIELQERKDMEIWNGMHCQVVAPAGTFEKIYNEAEDDIDV